MTEELIGKADHLSLAYKTKYSEDYKLKDMLSRPKDFVEGAIEGIINLLRQKAWRDGYIAGATENGIQWHDLRKDLNDLPPKENDVYSKEVRVCLGAGRYMHSVFSYALKEDGDKHCWVGCDPIAWCEEPQFKE